MSVGGYKGEPEAGSGSRYKNVRLCTARAAATDFAGYAPEARLRSR